jgi:hypothetical protein
MSGMRNQKEKTLIRYRDIRETECLCIPILELKRQRLFDHYNCLKEQLANAKVAGKNFQRILVRVMKTGNKLRAIKEAIEEIHQSYEILSKMITIEINGVSVSRLSRESDYRRSCKGKVAYSERSVEQAALEMAEKVGDSMEAYKCRHCQHYHVGHSVF